MFSDFVRFAGFLVVSMCAACTNQSAVALDGESSGWLLVDDFETTPTLQGWTNIDVQNDTDPFVPNPQISIFRSSQEQVISTC